MTIIDPVGEIANTLINNLMVAHKKISTNCDAKNITALIRLSKFIYLFSDKRRNVLGNVLPKYDGERCDNPPNKL